MSGENIYAHTSDRDVYPEYLSINNRHGGVEVTVRSPPEAGRCGDTAAIVLTHDQAREMLKELQAFLS